MKAFLGSCLARLDVAHGLADDRLQSFQRAAARVAEVAMTFAV
jgi:hypothetical protein